jgi:hypothetical protein
MKPTLNDYVEAIKDLKTTIPGLMAVVGSLIYLLKYFGLDIPPDTEKILLAIAVVASGIGLVLASAPTKEIINTLEDTLKGVEPTNETKPDRKD